MIETTLICKNIQEKKNTKASEEHKYTQTSKYSKEIKTWFAFHHTIHPLWPSLDTQF